MCSQQQLKLNKRQTSRSNPSHTKEKWNDFIIIQCYCMIATLLEVKLYRETQCNYKTLDFILFHSQ